jgi:hypothetical protein
MDTLSSRRSTVERRCEEEGGFGRTGGEIRTCCCRGGWEDIGFWRYVAFSRADCSVQADLGHCTLCTDGDAHVAGRTSSDMADPGLYVYDVASNSWDSEFPGVSGPVADDIRGIGSSDGASEDGGDTTSGSGSGSSSRPSVSEVVVTKTDAAGGVVLSTRTVVVGAQTTRVVVFTSTSIDVVVTTDQAGVTGEYSGEKDYIRSLNC